MKTRERERGRKEKMDPKMCTYTNSDIIVYIFDVPLYNQHVCVYKIKYVHVTIYMNMNAHTYTYIGINMYE